MAEATSNDLSGRVALVTGAGKPNGIGYAAAERLAAAGATVVLTDLEKGAIGERPFELLDVTDPGNVEDVVGRVTEQHGAIDILFNNAGTPAGAGAFLDIPPDAWALSWQVNVMGMVNLCRAVIPAMQGRGRGAIINNASLAGLGAIGNLSAYVTTKFAVVGLTKSLAIEFGPRGIRCNAVCPGLVWTDMGRLEVEHFAAAGEDVAAGKARLAADVPLGRWADPREVGEAVAFLASDRASYLNGVALPVAGGLAPGL